MKYYPQKFVNNKISKSISNIADYIDAADSLNPENKLISYEYIEKAHDLVLKLSDYVERNKRVKTLPSQRKEVKDLEQRINEWRKLNK